MKNNFKNILNCGILGAFTLLGAASCSDDHFDVLPENGAEGNMTVWQRIEQDSTLTDVAAILRKARVMKDDKDKKSKLVYSEWLNQPGEISAWLPKNGSFDKEPWLALLEDTGNDTLNLKNQYTVVNQFVRNHIAMFNHNSGNSIDEVRMLNAKNMTLDRSKSSFGDVHYDADKVTYNSNGMLYVLDGKTDFAYNIFDYLSTNPKFDSIYSIISDPEVDKYIFWPEASTQGAINEKGEIVYVDSVYRNENVMLNSTGALIKSEDSIYIAFMPQNEAWTATYNAVRPLFDYADSYNYEYKRNPDDPKKDGFVNQGNKALKFNVDSLAELNTRKTIIGAMFFNPSAFKNVDKTDSAQLIHYVMYADSLIATNGVVFYNPKRDKNNPNSQLNPMFEGLVPIKASNGYIFAPNEDYCRIQPEKSYMRRSEVRPNSIIMSLINTIDPNRGEVITLTQDNWQDSLVTGEVKDDMYQYFRRKNGNMILKFRLNGLPSGHYKITAQMLPNRVNKNKVDHDGKGNVIIEKPKVNAEYNDDKGSIKRNNKENFNVSQDEIQNVVVFDDLYLPYSYMGLPNGYETFPYFQLQLKTGSSGGRSEALSIAKIMIEPVAVKE